MTLSPTQKVRRAASFALAAVCASSLFATSASAAAKPDGSYSVAVTRIDKVSGSEITFTPIAGTTAAGIAEKISTKKVTAKLDDSAKRGLSTASENRVASIVGYVKDTSHRQMYMVMTGCIPKSSGGCTPVMSPMFRWVEEYKLIVTAVRMIDGGQCVSTPTVKVDIPWSYPNTTFSVLMCRANDSLYVRSPESSGYTIQSLSLVVSRRDVRRIPVRPGLWDRAPFSISGKLAGEVHITYDVANDGKPPVTAKFSGFAV